MASAGRGSGVLFLLVAAFLCGCSGRHQIDRAQRLEDQGKYSEAAVLYERLLPHYSGQPKKESLLRARLGEVLLRADHAQEAFNAFVKATELDPSNVLAHLRLAQLFIAANLPEKACEHITVVLQQQPNHPEALAAMGAYYLSVGETAKAEQKFQQVLAVEPGRQSAAVALADLYGSAQEVDKARQVLLRSAAASQTDPQALLALGRLEEQQGNGQAAETAYRNAVKAQDSQETNLRLAQHLLRSAKVKEAEQILGHVDSGKPSESTWLADFELSSGHAVKAAVHYLSTLQGRLADPHDRATQRTAALAARVIEADLDTARQLPGTDGASIEGIQGGAAVVHIHLETYRTKLDPATLATLEAEIALVEGDLATATQKANEAVSDGTDSAAAYFVLGEVEKIRGDEPGAIAHWNSALNKDPGYTPALLAIAQSDYGVAHYAAAEEKASAVVRHEPANLAALLLYARILAGSGDYAAARSIAARAMALARQSAGPHVVLGEIEMKQQRPAMALLQFQQAVVLEPHSREALEGLTTVYRQGVIRPEMIASLEHTADAPPRSSALMEIAGRLYSDRHMYDDATRCFTRALQIDRQRATAVMALAENTIARQQDAAFTELQSLAGKLGGSADALLNAIVAQDENRPEQAIAGYESAIRRGEYTGVAANNLAWLYAQKGENLDRALELARDAHDRDPKSAAVMDTLGFVYLTRREYSQAVNVLKAAITLADSQSALLDTETRNSLRQHLAEACARSGEASASHEQVLGRRNDGKQVAISN